MKQITLSAVAMASAAGCAFAADLPRYEAPLPSPAPVMTWTGFYVGATSGGTWSESGRIDTTSSFLFGDPGFPFGAAYTGTQSALGATGQAPVRSGGFIGGGQVGYSRQVSQSFVAGVEADIQGVAAGRTRGSAFTATPLLGVFPDGTIYSPGETFSTSIAGSKQIDFLGTVRGRVGWLVTPTLLLYATGGLAYGQVSATTSIRQLNNDRIFGPFSLDPSATAGGGFSGVRVGWTAGGGIEWMFRPSWSAKVEYLFYDLGAVTYALSPLATTANYGTGVQSVVASRSATRFDGHIVRAGVTWHFDWGAAPVVAEY